MNEGLTRHQPIETQNLSPNELEKKILDLKGILIPANTTDRSIHFDLTLFDHQRLVDINKALVTASNLRDISSRIDKLNNPAEIGELLLEDVVQPFDGYISTLSFTGTLIRLLTKHKDITEIPTGTINIRPNIPSPDRENSLPLDYNKLSEDKKPTLPNSSLTPDVDNGERTFVGLPQLKEGVTFDSLSKPVQKAVTETRSHVDVIAGFNIKLRDIIDTLTTTPDNTKIGELKAEISNTFGSIQQEFATNKGLEEAFEIMANKDITK